MERGKKAFGFFGKGKKVLIESGRNKLGKLEKSDPIHFESTCVIVRL